MFIRTYERGQVLPFFAVCLAVLMGFAGFAVDMGYVQYQQRQQQSATDAAAIAGAQALIASDTCPDNTAALTAAQNDAAVNGFANSASVSVTAGTPGSGPFSADNCAVQATIQSPHASWFSQLFGFGSGDLSTTAIAVVESGSQGNGCLYLLNGSLSSAGNNIDSPNCGVLINGGVSTAGGTVDTDYFGYSGTYSAAGTSYTEASPMPELPVANPCPNITGCNYLTNNPPAKPASTSGCSSYTVTANNQTIPAGCYSSISDAGDTFTISAGSNVGTISMAGGSVTIGSDTDIGGISGAGSTVNFDPGMYVFTGSISLAGDTVTGNGVTFYQESGGFSDAGATATLTACTTSCSGGAESGVMYFQPPSNTSASSFAGSSTNYSGLVYAPTATVSAAGTGTGYTIWVVASASIAGNTFSDTPPSPGPDAGPTPAGLYIKQSVLAY